MSNGLNHMKLIEVKDYLDATIEASTRVRSVTITMVIASVLIFGGLINSLQHEWMLERMHALADPHGSYAERKIGPYPSAANLAPAAYADAVANYKERYRYFYEAVARSYVDNELSVKVPLFGFSVDANDLGIVGGIAFIVILIMYRYSITREVGNLRIARNEARRLGQFAEFYNVLAMRQVFTIPPSDTITASPLLVAGPKLICALPLAVHTTVMVHDMRTNGIGAMISEVHNFFLLGFELAAFVALVALTSMAITRHLRIDAVWREWWDEIHGGESGPALQALEEEAAVIVAVGVLEG
jgi:hypothetical protein